ncbi:MAG: AMP-binding protein [Filifactor alocis]|nr:AMP-binding protein [Filifactor alocis]
MSKIIDKFEEACLSYADRTAFFYLQHNRIREVSFGQLGIDVDNMEVLLREKGLGEGGRVLIFVPPSYELVVFMFACLKIGASAMYVDVWAGRKLIAETLSQYKADYIAVSKKTRFLKLAFGDINKIRRMLFIDRLYERSRTLEVGPDQAEKKRVSNDDQGGCLTFPGRKGEAENHVSLGEEKEEGRVEALSGFAAIEKDGKRRGPDTCVRRGEEVAGHRSEGLDGKEEKSRKLINSDKDEEDTRPALLTMTTGSTGRPKIALRTRLDLYRQLELINDNMEDEGENVVLTTAFMYCFANVLKGFTTVLPQVNPGFLPYFLDRRLKKFGSLPITSIITSPDFCLKTGNFYPGLKNLYLGGAILNHEEARGIVRKYPGAKITYIYGATECNLIAKTDLHSYLARLQEGGPALLGRAVKGVRIRIDEDGEIAVNSKAILKDYLSHDRANSMIDEDGEFWHKTGDAGEYRDGRLYYLGRKDVYVEDGGRRLYSNPLEQELVLALEGVKKCAFFHHGGRNRLFLQGGSLTEEEVRACLRQRGLPAEVEIYLNAKIPCDVKHHTKIDYKKLRRRLDKGK